MSASSVARPTLVERQDVIWRLGAGTASTMRSWCVEAAVMSVRYDQSFNRAFE